MFHARDARLGHLAVVFTVENLGVISVQAGLREVVEGDEACAW